MLTLATGSENCGVIQRLSDAIQVKTKTDGKTVTRDSYLEIQQGNDIVDKDLAPEGT